MPMPVGPNRNLQISKAPLKGQAQGTSLFTSAACICLPVVVVLYCILFYFIVFYCIVFYFIVFYCIVYEYLYSSSHGVSQTEELSCISVPGKRLDLSERETKKGEQTE